MKESTSKHRPLIRAVALFVVSILLYVIGSATGIFSSLPKPSFSLANILRGLFFLLLLFAVEGVLNYVLTLLHPKKNRSRTMIALAKNLVRYAVILIAICVVLTMFNVDIVTILAGLGIVALIIGFGAESLIADVVTGMFILIDNQYNIGDIIEVNGYRGTVTDINVRTTVLTDIGGNVKIINNSDMKNILNRSDNTSRSVAEFPIPYETDLEDLETKIPAMLQRIYEAHPDVMKNIPVYVGVDALGDSAVILKFVVEVSESNIYSGARLLNHDLFIEMRKAGVEVPFPQMDVHQK